MTHIAVIGTVGVPACYGGFESLVDNLLDHTPPGVRYTVFCSAKKYAVRPETYKGARLVYLGLDANGRESVLYDLRSMLIASRMGADVMLILGVSGCPFLPLVRRVFRGRIITNIDGLEWRRDKWGRVARWLLRLGERMAVRHSDIIIGDNRGITDYVAEEYGRQSVLIAYGGDNAARVDDDTLFGKYPFCRGPYAVTVCRIEPENNVHVILEAFSRMPGHRLVIAGNWEKSAYGRGLRERYAAAGNIHLLDPVYEPHAVNWLRSNARLYVHGHSAGGTNPSLVEAMSLGLPVLAFDCVYNRATTEEKALYWKDAESLARTADDRAPDFARVARDMMEIAGRRYRWEHVAAQYNALYADGVDATAGSAPPL